MYKKVICAACGAALSLSSFGETIDIKSLNYSGPFEVATPFMLDSIDANSAKFDTLAILKTPISMNAAEKGSKFTNQVLPASRTPALHLLNFTLDNGRYFNGSLKVSGLKNREIYLDGKLITDEKLALAPATHSITVKCLTLPGNQPDSVRISIESDGKTQVTINKEQGRRYTLRDVMTGQRIKSASLSPSGKYLLTTYSFTHEGGDNTFNTQISELSSGRVLLSSTETLRWMPDGDQIYLTRNVNKKLRFITLNPLTHEERVIADDIPTHSFMLSPTADFFVYLKNQDEPKEKNADLYEIVNPEDRQPGWRTRASLMKFDLASGLSSPLTFGYRNVTPAGISADGSKLLFMAYDTKVEQRPSSVVSLYLLDLKSGACMTLLENEGFIGGASLSPDGKTVALTASPEGLGSIGKNLPDGMTPNMYDNQLYVMDVATKKVTPLTRDFNPSVESFAWSKADGNIYFTAEDRDLKSLYRVNPTNGQIDNLKALEEYVMSFDLSATAPVLVYTGQGASNSDRLYSVSLKNGRQNLIEDLSAKRLEGVRLGECKGWPFVTSRGDSISVRYILPPDFDPSEKYPMIVNYYGGCSPTSRTFESRYPHHVYAAHGYVVLVIIPRGSAGFGQEYAAHHVNTAGEGVADDIIEAVKAFTDSHCWVDSKKIGCIGASYGGFMTQYLQTKTDIFAAGISHAGISDHTSYWGEGYWGYSYSEVCMANSYPWTRKDLFVDRSPLFNADKIHTPLLFLHGDSDTNVPFGESIQMYTALKRLGRETAFVAVRGANHQVTEFNKRKQWQETIFAWFAKYLQDDPSWWEAMYPKKSL